MDADGPMSEPVAKGCLAPMNIPLRSTWLPLLLAPWLLLAGCERREPPPATTVATSAATPATADWPMFRGSQALTGIAEGRLPDKLSLLWSAKTGGPVKSSAAIAGGKVFVGSDDGNLYAFDLARGS